MIYTNFQSDAQVPIKHLNRTLYDFQTVESELMALIPLSKHMWLLSLHLILVRSLNTILSFCKR